LGKTYDLKQMITNSASLFTLALGLPFPSSSLPDPKGNPTLTASPQLPGYGKKNRKCYPLLDDKSLIPKVICRHLMPEIAG
jgi:hypothetical protein